MDKDKILKDIFEDDPLGLLNVKPTNSPARNEDERLVASFQETDQWHERVVLTESEIEGRSFVTTDGILVY